MSQRLIIALLGAFFAAQTWAAASYYLGDYPWDERFAWRMFSTVRGLKCDYRIWRAKPDGNERCPDLSSARCERVRLSKEQHMVWVNLMRRGRLSVLDQLASHDCAQQGDGGGYFVALSCQAPEPPHALQPIQSERVNLCEHPQRRSMSTDLVGGER